jgi:hypothetical protein
MCKDMNSEKNNFHMVFIIKLCDGKYLMFQMGSLI